MTTTPASSSAALPAAATRSAPPVIVPPLGGVLPSPAQGRLLWCVLRDAAPRPTGPQRDRAGDDAPSDRRRGGPTAADRVGERRGETLSDVDLLVHPDHVDEAARLLRAAGFVERPAWGRGSHRFFYRYDAATGAWLKLDVVTEIAFGGAQQYATDLVGPVLARCAGSTTPAAVDEFWILLLHCLLDRHGVCGRHAGRLAALLPVARTAVEGRRLGDVVRDLIGDDGVDRLLAAVDAGETDLSAHATALESAWRRGRRGRVLGRRLRALAARAATKVLTARRRPGVAVAVVGPDGAGKSSVVTALTRTYPFPVLSFYAGQYQGGGGRTTRLPGGRTGSLLVRQARQSLATFGHTRRGRVVVFDRYAYDSLLPRPGASAKTRLRRALLGRVALRPHLVVVLDAPGEVLHARSGEHSAAALEEQRARYAALAASQPGWVVVDALQPPDAVRRAVTAATWQCQGRRWRQQ